ncbi:alpha/beta fold hydrolase [Actinacidiphila guanduensis]|jgi:pimeloyl-ACP methyl ester carboxylesterase|uniref:Pimeloyl-ACP methyl ester carboxylesterase n=1 Tax=Actinacidiphila guanduensis TaxID=310781 RepID=A0A1G9VGK3_9ACTN|nr:alpha/beta hydrolase [Actinacidiphila guanduensis]SDM71246.1 Pimeloyl-ACP methyl ester carboxylesterase [Actinacidiphila guanduensis]
MPTAVIDGITTRYETAGSGPPLLMFSPGGFDSTLESWRTVGVYKRLNLLAHLTRSHTCITFDRRESGHSGGRVERIGWADYVRQGLGLLDHLGIERAWLMGGCVGCSTVAATAVARPERVAGMVLYSPAGGVKYRMKQHTRFTAHLAYAAEHGLAQVAELARTTDAGFSADPRVGPWASVLRRDEEFAKAYAAGDLGRYLTAVTGTARLLFDRDTVPGPEPEDLLALDVPALIVPGQDDSHAPSAARYLQECLPRNEFWDVPVAEQTEETAPRRILEFLGSA